MGLICTHTRKGSKAHEPAGHHPYQALTQLDLDSNVLGDEGASALAAALGGCALRVLRLHDNGVADAGAAALASALPISALELLALGDNPVGAAGAAALARTAHAAPSLRLLDLRGAEPQAHMHCAYTAHTLHALHTHYTACTSALMHTIKHSCSSCAAGPRDGAGGRRRVRDMPRALRPSRLGLVARAGYARLPRAQGFVGVHTPLLGCGCEGYVGGAGWCAGGGWVG